jgi:hypothetical protein
MRKLNLSPALQEEFATVEAVLNTGGTTRRVDALLLCWVKYEKQLRRLFSFLVFQHPTFTEDTIDSVISALVENTKLYPETFIKGINQLKVRSVSDLLGTKYNALNAEINRIRRYRNKLMHGQITGQNIRSRQIELDISYLIEWIETLAVAADSEFGYDGIRRKTYRSAKSSARIAVAKYPFDDALEFKGWLSKLAGGE